jgi:hypothetical protein
MPSLNAISAYFIVLNIVALFGCLIFVHWNNWKKAKVAKADDIRREVQSHKTAEPDSIK